ncbi:MAG TPA: hypothetical protein VKM55_29850 [Candidatus Lokiarchaeia archaeon]|nr:hypothetical protein [Candidatus Lokiarchaeia archaeon]
MGEGALSRIDINQIPIVLKGELRSILQELGEENVDLVISSLEEYFYKNYDVFSFGAY